MAVKRGRWFYDLPLFGTVRLVSSSDGSDLSLTVAALSFCVESPGYDR